ncbi:hypothetical protein F5876DRAFT_52640, partial [Lentinula aff. lateritia]
DRVKHTFNTTVHATGFHTITAPYTDLTVHAADETDILKKWANSVHSHPGMTLPGFPNFFYMYGPQILGPTCSVCLIYTSLKIF